MARIAQIAYRCTRVAPRVTRSAPPAPLRGPFDAGVVTAGGTLGILIPLR
jgi:hypothetical protein